MKKKRIELFPEMNDLKSLADEEYQLRLVEFSLGKIYRIGKPSDVHYKFIRPFMSADKTSIEMLDDFKNIEGLLIRVISILQMVGGRKIAVLRHYKEELFLEKFEKIFAQVDMSLSSNEIVPLDLETKRILESGSYITS